MNSVGMLLGINFLWPEAVNLSVCAIILINTQLATLAVFTLLITSLPLLIIFLLSELKAMVICGSSFGTPVYTSRDTLWGYLEAGLLCSFARHYPVRKMKGG